MYKDPSQTYKKKKNIFFYLYGDTIHKKLFRLYCLVIAVGFVLLFLPISLNNSTFSYTDFKYTITGTNKKYTFFHSLFTAISSFTNTGLNIHNVSKTFSFFGKLVILFLIQIGGIGFLTILSFIWSFFTRKKKFNFEQRKLFHFERGNHSQGSSLSVVKTGIFVLLITEVIGAILLTIFFYFVDQTKYTDSNNNHSGNPTKNLTQSVWYGIFHSISAVNNAGFDIISENSICSYSKGYGNILSFIMFLQSFVGGIGYPVFYDIYLWMKNRSKHLIARTTLFTKISLIMYFLISFFAIIFILVIEFGSGNYQNIGQGFSLSAVDKVWNLIYLTFSSRSSGFTGIKITDLHEKTQWLLTILMFIGASPASTAGGIRSITLFLIFLKIWNIMMGRKYVSVFSKTIYKKTIEESFSVFFVSVALISLFSLLIGNNLSDNKTHYSLFEASSAFGTAGLSVGITETASNGTQILLMILMFIGQLGVSNALLSWTKSRPNKKYISYCIEDVRII